MYHFGGLTMGSVSFWRSFTRRRGLCIVRDDFSLKNHLSLTPPLLLSAKGPARLVCSLANARPTTRCRCQHFAVFGHPNQIRYEHSYQTKEIRTGSSLWETGSDFFSSFRMISFSTALRFIKNPNRGARGKRKSMMIHLRRHPPPAS